MCVCRQSMRPALFLRKSNSFQLADLFSTQFVLLRVGLLAYLLAAVAEEDIGQPGQRLLLPPSHLGRVVGICAIWAAVLCALMASTTTSPSGWVGDSCSLGIDSSPFSMPPLYT